MNKILLIYDGASTSYTVLYSWFFFLYYWGTGVLPLLRHLLRWQGRIRRFTKYLKTAWTLGVQRLNFRYFGKTFVKSKNIDKVI